MEDKKTVETDVDKAKRLIEEDRKQREESCANEINEILKKYNCIAVIEGRFSGNQFESGLRIQSL